VDVDLLLVGPVAGDDFLDQVLVLREVPAHALVDDRVVGAGDHGAAVLVVADVLAAGLAVGEQGGEVAAERGAGQPGAFRDFSWLMFFPSGPPPPPVPARISPCPSPVTPPAAPYTPPVNAALYAKRLLNRLPSGRNTCPCGPPPPPPPTITSWGPAPSTLPAA